MNNSLSHPSTTATQGTSYYPSVCTNGMEPASKTDAYVQWSTDYIEIY